MAVHSTRAAPKPGRDAGAAFVDDQHPRVVRELDLPRHQGPVLSGRTEPGIGHSPPPVSEKPAIVPEPALIT